MRKRKITEFKLNVPKGNLTPLRPESEAPSEHVEGTVYEMSEPLEIDNEVRESIISDFRLVAYQDSGSTPIQVKTDINIDESTGKILKERDDRCQTSRVEPQFEFGEDEGTVLDDQLKVEEMKDEMREEEGEEEKRKG